MLGLILALEVNGLFGRLGPLARVVGVIHCSLGLTGVLFTSLCHFLKLPIAGDDLCPKTIFNLTSIKH